jgi:hypothetical protein
MTDMKVAGYIRRRNNNGEGFFRRVGICRERTGIDPLGIERAFDIARKK